MPKHKMGSRKTNPPSEGVDQESLAILAKLLNQQTIVIGGSLKPSKCIERVPEIVEPLNFDLVLLPHHGSAAPTEAVSLSPAPLPQPLKLAETLLWLLLPRKVRGAVIGDAREAYVDTLRRYPNAHWIANLDFYKEALFGILASARISLASFIDLLLRRSP